MFKGAPCSNEPPSTLLVDIDLVKIKNWVRKKKKNSLIKLKMIIIEWIVYWMNISVIRIINEAIKEYNGVYH